MRKILAFLKCAFYVALMTGAQYLVALLMIIYKYATTDLPLDGIIDSVFNSHTVTITYVSAVLTIGVIWLLSMLWKRKFSSFIDWGKNVTGRMTYACVLVGIGGNFWTTIVMQSIFSVSAMEEYNSASGNMDVTMSAMALFGVAVIVPIMEEIVFRGIILNRFSEEMNVELAIILQGIIFGSLHGDIVWITYAVFMGLILGYIRVCTNSLKASIITHMAYNISSPIGAIISYSFMGVANADIILVLTGAFLMVSGLFAIYKYQPEK